MSFTYPLFLFIVLLMLAKLKHDETGLTPFLNEDENEMYIIAQQKKIEKYLRLDKMRKDKKAKEEQIDKIKEKKDEEKKNKNN